MFIPREITNHISELRGKYPVLSIVGPRQSGKTTLLKEILPEYQYVSLEDAEIRILAKDDPRQFLKRFDNKVIFDEAQKAPELFSYLQTKVDEDRIMGQYVLSGSQNFQLLENITQSLAGRVALLTLLPFSFSEMEGGGIDVGQWEYAAFFGFYPAIYDRGINPTIFYSNYIETYLERDVRNLLAVKDLGLFRLFLKRCAGNAGQILNLHSIATECGITSPTAKAWFSILESSYIVFSLTPWFRNFNKRIIKSPKLFFYDTGLVCNLLEMDDPKDLVNYFQRGSIFENLVVAELYKKSYHAGRRPSYYFWQDSNHNEIDLLWEKAGVTSILEIKSGQTINPGFFNNLAKFAKQDGLRLDQQYLIYGGNDKYEHLGVNVVGWRGIKDIAI